MGLYNTYVPMINQNPLDATQMANNFTGIGSQYSVPINKNIDYNWNNPQQGLPYANSITNTAVNDGSWWDDFDLSGTVKGFSDLAGGVSGLYGMYLGKEMLGLQRDQLNASKQNLAYNQNRLTNFDKKSDASIKKIYG